MLRLGFAVTIIATIYMHSPQRPETGVGDVVSSWVGAAERSLASVALKSPVAPVIAEAALRRTLSLADADPHPTQGDASAQPSR